MRKKDLKFLVKSILKEIREYNISKDKEVLLYDFYVLSYIRTLNFDSSKPSKISGFADEPDKYGGFFGKDPEELKSVISDAEKKLIPVLKKDLLDAVYYSICCEMRHALDKKQNVDTDYPEFKKRHPKAYEYVKQLQSAWNSSGESFSRIESFKVANDIFSENDRYEFVKASGEIFENWKWGPAYGGKNWKDICDAWLYLDKAGSIMESIVCIDNLYHQQHNTGSVLNKVASYSKSGSYAWLAKALEDKAVNWWNTPWKLLPKCSSDMRRIALMAFKKAGVNIGNVDPSQFLTNKQKPSSKPLENVINSHMYNLLKDIKNELEKNETIKSKGIKFEVNYQSYWKGSLTILFASTPDWKINIQKEGDGYKITDKIKTDGVFKSPSHIKKALIDWVINSIEFSLGIKINTSSKSRSDLNAKTESVLKDLSGSFIHIPNSNLNPTKLRILYKKSDNLNPDKLKISYKKSDNLEPNSGIYYIYLYEDMTNFKFIQIVVPLSPYNSQNLYRITVENGGEKTYPADIDLEDTLKNIIKTIIKSSKNVDVEITSSKQFSIDNKSQSKKRSDNLKLAKTVAEGVKDKYYNNKLEEIAEINNIPIDSDSFRISFKMAAAGAPYNIRVKSMGNPTTEGYWLMDDIGKSKISTIAELEKTIINEYLNPYISNFYNGLPQYNSYILNPDRIKTTPKKNDKQKLLEVIQSIRDEYISNNFYDIGNITTAVFDQFTENWKYGLTIKFRTKNVINFITDIVYPFPNDKQKAKSYKTYFFKNDIKYSEYDSDNLEILRDIYIIRINQELINEGYPEKYKLQSDIEDL